MPVHGASYYTVRVCVFDELDATITYGSRERRRLLTVRGQRGGGGGHKYVRNSKTLHKCVSEILRNGEC